MVITAIVIVIVIVIAIVIAQGGRPHRVGPQLDGAGEPEGAHLVDY